MTLSGADLTGSSDNDEIMTPDDLFAWLHRRFGFNYDAFASHANALLPLYSTDQGTYRKDVTRFVEEWNGLFHGLEQVSAHTGLEHMLHNTGLRLFANPPYSSPLLRQAIEAVIEARNILDIGVMLVKYDSSTKNGELLRRWFTIPEWGYLPRIRYKYSLEAIAEMKAKTEARTGKKLPDDWAPPSATFASVVAIVSPDKWRASR